jgi:hypothetical protein
VFRAAKPGSAGDSPTAASRPPDYPQSILTASRGFSSGGLDQHAAQELYARVCKFTEHFEKIRAGLEKATSAFNDATGSYERMVRPSGERLLKLRGDSQGKELVKVQSLDPVLRLPSTDQRE